MEHNEDESELVRPKTYVILTRGEEFMLHKIENKPRVKFFSSNIDLGNIVGKPYWSVYRMERVRSKYGNYYCLEYCDPSDVNANVLENIECGLDNRLIEDDNNAQALSKDEILTMRSNGHSSKEILGEIIKNSRSFSKKTEYAQQKYVKKKSKKYSDYIQVLKPTIRLLTAVLLRGAVSPYMGLRFETLTQIVPSLAFQPDGKYIVYENCCFGLIIASLLEKLHARGKLLNVITNNYPFRKLKALSAMNFSEDQLARLIHIRSYFFLKYSQIKNHTDSDFLTDTDQDDGVYLVGKNTAQDNDMQTDTNQEDGGSSKRKNTASTEVSEKRTKELEKQAEEVRCLLQEKADGLIFVCRDIVTSELCTMLQFLAPSRPFVVYSQFKEPLVQLFIELKQRQDVVFVRIFENSSRMYQVLPERTHPHNMMYSSCGFLLTGVTVEHEEGET